MIRKAERREGQIFRENILLFRKKRGWDQLDFADRVSVSRETISAYETGRAYPTMETLFKIADVLDIPVSRLFEETRL